jgi:predicted nucleic acid-binding protein
LPAGELVYLDASAFVKLVVPEPETRDLSAALEGVQRIVASEILEVEALRAARRAGRPTTAIRTQLAAVRLLAITPQIRTLAGALDPPSVRSLDAIHIATALKLSGRLAGMFTYDERMADAARAAGLSVHTPGAAKAPGV